MATSTGLVYWAHGAYLLAAAGVGLLVGFHLLGETGWLTPDLAAVLLTFGVMPITGITLLAGAAGILLTLRTSLDGRRIMLALLTVGLVVLVGRREALGVPVVATLVYPAGVALFSLHWLCARRASRGPRHL